MPGDARRPVAPHAVFRVTGVGIFDVVAEAIADAIEQPLFVDVAVVERNDDPAFGRAETIAVFADEPGLVLDFEPCGSGVAAAGAIVAALGFDTLEGSDFGAIHRSRSTIGLGLAIQVQQLAIETERVGVGVCDRRVNTSGILRDGTWAARDRRESRQRPALSQQSVAGTAGVQEGKIRL